MKTLRPAQAIIVLRFGSMPLNGPDPANQNLVRPCDQFAIEHDIPLLVERETARFAMSPKLVLLGESGDGLDTYGALKLAREKCEQLGIENIALGTGGGYHRFRAKLTAEKLGLNVVHEIVVSDVFFWGETPHWQTWSPWLNAPYEIAASFYYKMWRGWI